MSQSAFASGEKVIAQTGTTYTITGAFHRKMVTFNNASAVAVTIESPAATGNGFHCTIENLGAGAVTLTPASGTIDGSTSLALSQNQSIVIWSDGSNYFTERGMATGGGSFTASGDLSGTSSSQTVVGLQGKALDAATVGSPGDGDVIKYDSASGKYKAASESATGGGLIAYLTPSALTPPTLASLTWVNQGSATALNNAGGALYIDSGGKASVNNAIALVKSLPSAPWTATVGLVQMLNPTVAGYLRSALVLRESATGKLIILWVSNAYNGQFYLEKWTNATTYSSHYFQANNMFQLPILWLHVSSDGTNYTWGVSPDGQNIATYATHPLNDFFTTSADEYGVGLYNTNNSGQVLCVHMSAG